jgi:hypothetical protein
LDIRRNGSAAWDLVGRYSTEVFTEEAVRVIHEHDATQPMFLYMAHAAVHGSHVGRRLEAPQDTVNSLKYILDPNRRTYAGNLFKILRSDKRVDVRNMGQRVAKNLTEISSYPYETKLLAIHRILA